MDVNKDDWHYKFLIYKKVNELVFKHNYFHTVFKNFDWGFKSCENYIEDNVQQIKPTNVCSYFHEVVTKSLFWFLMSLGLTFLIFKYLVPVITLNGVLNLFLIILSSIIIGWSLFKFFKLVFKFFDSDKESLFLTRIMDHQDKFCTTVNYRDSDGESESDNEEEKS